MQKSPILLASRRKPAPCPRNDADEEHENSNTAPQVLEWSLKKPDEIIVADDANGSMKL
jgi:hypothetical protein